MLNSRRARGRTGFGALLNGGDAQQLPDDVLFTFFPREPSGDINWMDDIRAGFLRGEHGAVQPARQHHDWIPGRDSDWDREDMYSVTKKIEFCYGHRLLDYDGICKHPHGHNAVAEIEVRSGSLDNRNMVCDFSDIKRVVKGWVDRELDHKMILREDDPLVGPLQQLGEPVFVVQSNPTVEHIAKLLYDYTHSQGFPVVRVTVWETPTSFATFGGSRRELQLADLTANLTMQVTCLAVFDLDGTLIDSRRDLADSANEMLAGYGAAPLGEDRIASMVGCGAPTLVKRVLTAAGMTRRSRKRWRVFSPRTTSRLTQLHAPV